MRALECSASCGLVGISPSSGFCRWVFVDDGPTPFASFRAQTMNASNNSVGFGAPGMEPRWTSSAKEGLGTAYHTSCRVWFTLSHGIVNEIYYPRVDQPNTRDF